jgi:hypothetical protein
MLIPIQTKYNQISNDNIIRLPWWLHGTNIKKVAIKEIGSWNSKWT